MRYNYYLAALLSGFALVACGDEDTSERIDASPADASALPDATNNTDGGVTVDAASPDAGVGPDAMPNLTMSFFATSTGSGASGGDLGGLTSADAKCQLLAANGGGGGRIWHAYLSTGNIGPGPIVDARDRIGVGPWRNQQGALVANSIADLHSNGILGALIFDELGAVVPSNEHDILSGTAVNGTISDASETCDNWTNGTVNSQAQVGHADTESGDGESWNSTHSGSCDEASLAGNAGAGRLYCFAID